MKLTEKAAYLTGLMEGLDIDTSKPEGKLLAAIIDMLDDTAATVADLGDVIDAVSDELDSIEEDLDAIEEYLLDEIEEDEYEDEYEDEDDDFDYGDDEVIYEVKCPTCGEVIDLDEEMLDAGSTVCPKCGEDLEFDDTEEEF